MSTLRRAITDALLDACDPKVQVGSWIATHGSDSVVAWAPGSLGDGGYRDPRPLTIGEIINAVLPAIAAASSGRAATGEAADDE